MRFLSALGRYVRKWLVHAENRTFYGWQECQRRWILDQIHDRIALFCKEKSDMYMEKIASFTVDHNKLDRGIYTSRVDGDCYTFDLRMKKPNTGDVLATDAMHAIEHIGATWLRSSRFKDQIIYFGPMGCRTGFYLITRDLTGQPLVDLVIDAFWFIAAYEGEIPGASAKECGNYRDLSLEGAKQQAAEYLTAIEGYPAAWLDYDHE